MKRRGFLRALLGLAAAPAVAALPAPASVTIRKDTAVGPTGIFTGELGRWENVTIVESSHAADAMRCTVGDLRAKAMDDLAGWFARQVDAGVYAALAGDNGARALRAPWRPS